MKNFKAERATFHIDGFPPFSIEGHINIVYKEGLEDYELLEIENFNEENPLVSDIDDYVNKAKNRLHKYKFVVDKLLKEIKRLKNESNNR